MPFVIKVGETAKPLRARLVDGDGTTPDLSSASVKFSMKDKDTGVVVVDMQSASILSGLPPADADDPNVQYIFKAPDVSEAGNFLGEFVVDYGTVDGLYPDDTNIEITIRRSIS